MIIIIARNRLKGRGYGGLRLQPREHRGLANDRLLLGTAQLAEKS
jgi:hypothetical protein